jgi:hypothetical protein
MTSRFQKMTASFSEMTSHKNRTKPLKKNPQKTFPKYRIVTVTILTIYDSVFCRLKAVTMWLVLESFKGLVLASSFWDFLRLKKINQWHDNP